MASIALVTLLFRGSSRAQAQDTSSAELARRTFQRGIQASKESRWLEARAEFRRSVEQLAKPSSLYNLALADVMLGLGDEALEALDVFVQLAKLPEHAEMIDKARLLRSLATAQSERRRAAPQTGAALLDVPGLQDQALERATEARAAYERGELPEALRGFERAYDLTHRPELLFNVAVAADRVGANERAVLAYQAFAAALPDTPEAATARSRALLLGSVPTQPVGALAQAPAAESRASPGLTPPPPPAAPAPRLTLGTKLLLGSGAVTLAGAVGVAIWWGDRTVEHERCLHPHADKQCTNGAQLVHHQHVALGTTLALTVLTIPLLISGGVRGSRESKTPVTPRITLRLGRDGAHACSRWAF